MTCKPTKSTPIQTNGVYVCSRPSLWGGCGVVDKVSASSLSALEPHLQYQHWPLCHTPSNTHVCDVAPSVSRCCLWVVTPCWWGYHILQPRLPARLPPSDLGVVYLVRIFCLMYIHRHHHIHGIIASPRTNLDRSSPLYRECVT